MSISKLGYVYSSGRSAFLENNGSIQIIEHAGFINIPSRLNNFLEDQHYISIRQNSILTSSLSESVHQRLVSVVFEMNRGRNPTRNWLTFPINLYLLICRTTDKARRLEFLQVAPHAHLRQASCSPRTWTQMCLRNKLLSTTARSI